MAEQIGFQIGELTNYFQDRFDDLCRHADSYALACENYFSETAPFSVVSGLDWPRQSKLEEPAYRNPQFKSQWLVWNTGMRTASLSLNSMWPRLFKYRHDFRFSSRDVTIIVCEDGQAMLVFEGDADVFRVPAVASASRGTYSGSVEGVLRGEGGSIVLVISSNSGLVAVREVTGGSWNLPDLVEYFDEFPCVPVIVEAMAAISERQYLRKGAPAEEMVRFYTEQSHELILHLYMQLAYRVPGRIGRRIVTNLKDAGVKGALVDDDLIKKVAFWSLQCGAGVWDFATYAKELGISEQSIRDDIMEANSRLRSVLEGNDAFLIHDGQMVSTI